MEEQLSGHADADGGPLPAEAGKGIRKAAEQIDAFNELQRVSASPESAVRYLETVAEFDVRHLLAQVKAPTLVMHVRDERRVPVASGREMAAGIPNARFVALPGKNHVLLEQDPGMPIFMEELRSFLSKG
jgi:pimeloyl-ACP methyl ester carboxylesterase